MVSANTPQPAPVPTSASWPVWPTIFDNPHLGLTPWMVADMRERHELGRAKYGVALQTFNGRDPIIDAYQEALDLVVYTQQARLELAAATLNPSVEENWNRRLALDTVFHHALDAVRRLGELIKRSPEAA